MKPLPRALLLLVMVPALSALYGQDVTKPVIPVPPPPPAPVETHAAAPGTPQPPPAVSADYVIGPKDNLAISVWKEPTVSETAEVRPDGMISIPLLGDVKAADFTPSQLSQDITIRLKKYINDPLVTVTVLAVNSKLVFFEGEIKEGAMPYNPSLTPLQAIIEAGGPTQYARKTKIYILRTVKGKQIKIPFDYKKAVKTGDEQGVTLLPGDIIRVP
jgi:polysaccharide export outer membrane protein